MENGHVWTHQAEWSADPRHVGEARAFATRCLTDHLIVPSVDDVELVVSELATNAVIHAATAFTLTLARLDGLLTVTGRDGSAARPRLYYGPSATRSQGRGLQMVAALSSSWGVTDESDGKSVWATFDVTDAHPSKR